MAMAIVSAKGWVVIPAELRHRYALTPGDRVVIVDYGGVIAIVRAMDDPIAESVGLLRGDESLRSALRVDREQERSRGR